MILLVSCSRKTTQTVTADHTESRETAALTVEQWQALSQAVWQSQLHTQAEAVTDHIVINAAGDTVSRDITRHRAVSARTEQSNSAAKETVTKEQAKSTTAQAVAQDYRLDQVSNPHRPGISSLIIGVGVAVVLIWAFLLLHKVLARHSGA